MGKKMTAREKALRAKARKELKAEGLLPPDKKRLNRKKYCEEAYKIFWDKDAILFSQYLITGIGLMLKRYQTHKNAGAESVGVAKAVYIAKRVQELEQSEAVRENGGAYTATQLYDAIEEIINA